MEYTAVIRTLGTAGEKYQTLLNSLVAQTVKPKQIIVYIAEGYAKPKETVGIERYVYVKKGMVAQRALPYTEIDTAYMLFLDDDVFLPEDSVEKLYALLVEHNADVISPDVFPNAERSLASEMLMTLSGRMRARRNDARWGYKVMRTVGYSYNARPRQDVYWSQTNAGPCFFCSKENFLKIRFEEELWMDKQKYPIGEDQIMYYKMYLLGLKQLTWFHSGIKHLDAGVTLRNENKERQLIYADFRFKVIFWHRFIYLPEKSVFKNAWSVICISYALLFTLLISLVKGRIDILCLKYNAIKDGLRFIRSEAYRCIPLVKRIS